jgi:large subunit ribosomal protein L25
LKHLKAGKFLSTLLNVKVDGVDNRVICRGVQRDVVKDKPTHVDFLRLAETSRIRLYIPVEFINRDKSPGLKRGGVLTVVRPEVELFVTAGDIPEQIVVDLDGTNVNDTLHISDVTLPAGVSPTITDRDFVIANIQAPSGLRSEDNEGEAEAETA